MTGHHTDGTLVTWEDVKARADWDVLLIGNGLSVNVWPKFKYASLYEEAERGTRFGGLSAADKKLFKALNTKNFELVLADLNAAIRMAELLGEDAKPYYKRYQSVQAALGAAVRAAHIDRFDASDEALAVIQRTLKQFEWVFTTSYDLLVYWSMGYDDNYRGLCDCFWSSGRHSKNEFDPSHAGVWVNWTPVYYLHGALHLVVHGDGTTSKLKRSDKTLLDQFGKPIPGDAQARPLLISEGSSRDKLRAIDGNDYLSHALKRLRDRETPLVVFGHALGDQDQHLVDAINANPDRPVAVSMRPDSPKKLRLAQGLIRSKLHTADLFFYDSTTHPIGSPDLTRKSTFWFSIGRARSGQSRT